MRDSYIHSIDYILQLIEWANPSNFIINECIYTLITFKELIINF
ncbi:hypothetical protein PMAN_a1385 [Pseudoalteromonas marina]|nr:hypothetical protein PMAN_a1385 [Pseudoalteromonas marina]